MAIKMVLIILFIVLLIGFGGLAIYYTAANPADKFRYKRDAEEIKKEIEELNKKYKTKVNIFCILAIIALIGLIFVPGNIHQVNTGEVAVVRKMGKIESVREPGVYWDFYMIKTYEKFDSKIQQIDETTSTYSKDNQTIDVSFELQYSIDPVNVDRIAAEYGNIPKLENKIKAIALDNIKSVFAKNTATDVITNRAQISAEITQLVGSSINANYYVDVKTIVLTNIDFTDDFEAAVALKVAEEQKKQKADIENEALVAKAQAEAEKAKVEAESQAEVARIKAESDALVAKIESDTAEYQGKKQAAIAMNKLAGINGWYVIAITDAEGNTTGYKLLKSDGSVVTDTELQVGVKNLLEVYKYEKWDGELPTYMMGSDSTITVVTP